MVELYQDTLVDLLLPKNAKRLKLEIKKDTKVTSYFHLWCLNCNTKHPPILIREIGDDTDRTCR